MRKIRARAEGRSNSGRGRMIELREMKFSSKDYTNINLLILLAK